MAKRYTDTRVKKWGWAQSTQVGNIVSKRLVSFHLEIVLSLEPRDDTPSVTGMRWPRSLGAICRLDPRLVRSLPLLYPWIGASFSPRSTFCDWCKLGRAWGWGGGRCQRTQSYSDPVPLQEFRSVKSPLSRYKVRSSLRHPDACSCLCWPRTVSMCWFRDWSLQTPASVVKR